MAVRHDRPATIEEFPLPPGAYRDEQGELWHVMLVFRGFFDAEDRRLETPAALDEARRAGRGVFEDHSEEPRPAMCPPPWADPDPNSTDPGSVEQLRRQAVRDQKDFWHPVHGWLSWGKKRQKEATENLGSGSVARRRVRRPVAVPEGEGYELSGAETAEPVAPVVPEPVAERGAAKAGATRAQHAEERSR